MSAASRIQSAKSPLWILVLLAAVGPLAINIFLPSMPSIARDLDAPYATVQLGLTLYLVATALVSLVAGPISDKIGRKPVLLGSLGIFILGSLLCIFANNAALLLIGRVIQAASATGMVLSRAIVRDIFPREKSASMIGYVVMGMTLAPMIGPAIGGYIDQVAGWRWTFTLLMAFGAFTMLAAMQFLEETNQQIGQSVANQIESYVTLAKIPAYWLYVSAASLTSAVFFIFLGGGPAVSSVYFDLTPFEYGAYFACSAVGYATGNGFSGRYSERVGVEKMMVLGAIICLLGPGIALTLFLLASEPAAWMLFFPFVFVGLGNGLTLPNVTAASISIKPEAAGAASGLLGSLQIGIGGLGSIIGGIAVGESGSPFVLSFILLCVALIALIVTIIAARAGQRYG